MRRILRTTKALGDESRLRILAALRGRELCVCQLIELLELAPSTVSKHLSILRNARLIDSRKQGRWMYYRLEGEGASLKNAQVLEWLFRSIAHTGRIIEDTQKLKAILQIDPEELCGKQATAQCGVSQK